MPNTNILKLFFIWFFLPIYSAFSAFGPYEKCNWKNKHYTNRLVQQSQWGTSYNRQATAVCLDCLKNQTSFSTIRQVANLNQISGQLGGRSGSRSEYNIPSICFLAGTLKGRGRGWSPQADSYYYCPSAYSNQISRSMVFSGCSKTSRNSCTLHEPFKHRVGMHYRNITIRKPCLNEGYIDMTARAFNKVTDCFGFSSREAKKQLFALMNHESAFILNKRATPIKNQVNTARCYGQIKNGVIIDVNKYIRYPNEPHWKKYHQIYKDAIGRCPFLKNKTISLSNKCKQSSADRYISCLKRKQNDSALKCRTSQDPYSCLFYTLYNQKINQVRFDRVLKRQRHQVAVSETGKVLSPQKTNRLNQDFKLPIQLNEMISITGTITVRGVKKQISYVVRDTKEAYSIFGKSYVKYNIQDIQVKKTKLFKDKELKWAFSHLAHNGGHTIINTHLRPFLRKMKYMISSKKFSNRSKVIKKYRQSMVEGKSLKLSDLNTTFMLYAKTHKVSNRHEVSRFLGSLNRGLNYLTNKKNFLKNSIKTLPKDQKWPNPKINKWLRRVYNQCPTRLF